MNYKLQIINRGFTLVETLMAIFVLTIALSAILSLIGSSIFSAQYAKNEITAMYLAQEVIDHIRNDRDSLAFQGGDWNAFLFSYGYDSSGNQLKCFSVDGCEFEATNWSSTDIETCLNGNCDPLYYNANSTDEAYYNYNDTETKTSFYRKITMNAVSMDATTGNNDELNIAVEVKWMNGGIQHSRTLRTSLLKWQ